MAAAVAAAGAGEPLSPEELLPKAEAEKAEEELEEDDDDEIFQGSFVDWDHFLHDPGSSRCL
uniref:Translocase of outer mitochondrial membrane 22 n=1 Tax=Mus musculus TaxID=10090 RepID=A0A2R8VHJ4_MOUSE